MCHFHLLRGIPSNSPVVPELLPFTCLFFFCVFLVNKIELKFTQDCRGFFCQPMRTVLAKPATQPRRGEREAGATREPAFFYEALAEKKMQATEEP